MQGRYPRAPNRINAISLSLSSRTTMFRGKAHQKSCAPWLARLTPRIETPRTANRAYVQKLDPRIRTRTAAWAAKAWNELESWVVLRSLFF